MSTTATRSPAGTRPPGPRLPGALALGLMRTRIELLQFFRERDAVVFIFAYPIIMLAIFGAVFDGDDQRVGTSVGPGVDFAQYFLGGMVATGVMLTSLQSLALSVSLEREDGTLKRLRGTPLPPTSYFLGKVGLVLVTSAVQVALLLACAALLFDVPLPTGADRWVVFGWVFALGTTSGALLGVAASSLARSARSASAVITPVVIVLQFISGVFFIFAALPGWMQDLASVFPLKWMAQGMRSVFLPDQLAAVEASGSWQTGPTAMVLAGWTVVGLVLCLTTFRWTRRDAG